MQIHYKRLQEKEHLYLLQQLHINKILQKKMVISLNWVEGNMVWKSCENQLTGKMS